MEVKRIAHQSVISRLCMPLLGADVTLPLFVLQATKRWIASISLVDELDPLAEEIRVQDASARVPGDSDGTFACHVPAALLPFITSVSPVPDHHDTDRDALTSTIWLPFENAAGTRSPASGRDTGDGQLAADHAASEIYQRSA